jgi:mannosyltransferase OCH1-like enzyme
MIPKIIHKIAPSNKSVWKEEWSVCHETWETTFSDFEIKVWSDNSDEMGKFVLENYPKYYDFFKNLPYNICKIDFFRNLILHKHGGIYADMDYAVCEEFHNQLDNSFGIVESMGSEFPSWQETVQNCLMYSEKNNSLLIDFCENSIKILENEDYYKELNSNKLFFGGWIIKSIFGPIMYTNYIKENKISVQILPKNKFNRKYLNPANNSNITFKDFLKENDVTGHHFCTNYWGDDLYRKIDYETSQLGLF